MDPALDGIFLAHAEALPTAGKRLAVKDLFDTEGLVTTYGSAIFADHVPKATAEAVRRAEAAGWTVVGKANLHEFAYGISSQNPHFGTVPNPRAAGRLAGGSSGGSAAAIAAGLCDAALGTDSGGSIRIPAAWCGVVGFKPTYDLVSLDGCWPLAPSFDHAGPLAPTVEACAELMAALAPGFAPPRLASFDDLNVGLAWTELADEPVRTAVEAVAALVPGASRVDFPLPDPSEYAVFMREVADVHRPLFPDYGEEYGDNVRTKIERCLAVTDAEVERGREARDAYRHAAEEAFRNLDLLLTPTVEFLPPPVDVDELTIRERGIKLTYPFDSLGWPAVAIPCGSSEAGLPVSLQVVGRPGDDELVLGAAALLASLDRGTARA